MKSPPILIYMAALSRSDRRVNMHRRGVDWGLVVDRYSVHVLGLSKGRFISPRCPMMRALWFFLLGFFLLATNGSAGESGAAALKAKKEAEAKGFIFETSRDAIIAKAKQEGGVRVLSGLDQSSHASLMAGFRKKYPFLKIDMVEIAGPDSAQRFIMELKSGSKNDFDIIHASTEFYPEYLPFVKKFDLLGMAEAGVLRIPPKMIDPKHRAIAALGSALSVVAYKIGRASCRESVEIRAATVLGSQR